MKKDRAFTNYFYNVLLKGLTAVFSIVVSSHLAKTLGQDVTGISDYTGSIVSMIAIFATMGISLYGEKRMSELRDNRQELSRAFWNIIALRLIGVLVGLCITLIALFFVKYDYKTVLLIQLITLPTMAIDITFLYVGEENFRTTAIRNTILKIVNVILIKWLIQSPNDLILFVVINVSTAFLGNLSLWLGHRKYVDFVMPTLEGIKENIMPALKMFAPQAAISLYTILDKTMIGSLYNMANVTFYNIANSLAQVLISIATSISEVLWPRLVNVRTKGDNTEAERLISLALKLNFMVAIPMCFGLAAVGPTFTKWVYEVNNPAYYEAGIMMIFMAPLIIIISVNRILAFQIVVPAGHLDDYSKSIYLACVVNTISNFLLIPRFGGYGAIVASAIGESSTMIYLYFKARKIVKFDGIFFVFVRYLCVSIIMYIAVRYVGSLLPASLLTNALQVVTGVAVYAIILLVMKDENVYRILKR